MTALRILLAVLWLAVSAYTFVTVSNDGINFLPAYFGDVAKMGWPGQFNVDFTSYLILSGIWLAWRHEFSAKGFAFGLIAPVGGMIFLGLYLLIVITKDRPDAAQLFLGNVRAKALKG